MNTNSYRKRKKEEFEAEIRGDRVEEEEEGGAPDHRKAWHGPV